MDENNTCIRDATSRCKCCGSYWFPEDINWDGLCPMCARGDIPPKRDVDDSGWGDW